MNKQINLQYTTITTPLPDFIYENLREYSRNANGYRPQPTELIAKLSKKHNVPKEMFYLTAGADEAIQMFALAYGQKTYFFTPTYIVYNDTKDFYANTNGINAFVDNNYKISTDNIPDATLIYLANPNNPCGFTAKENVVTLINNNPQAIVVIDEVYAEFADISVIDLVQKYTNLAVLRSFSKSYGMAGNRIGFIVANPKVILKVKSKTQWSNVSYLSVGAAMSALEHESYFIEVIDGIKQRRDEFTKILRAKGFIVIASLINAVLINFETEDKGSSFARYLSNNNFIISHGNGASNVGLDKSFVRVSIGNEDEMRILKEIIMKYK